MRSIVVLLIAVLAIPGGMFASYRLFQWSGAAFWIRGEAETAEYLVGAAQFGCLDEVKRVLRSGRVIGAAQDRSGYTALMAAATRGNADLVAYLIDQGARPSAATHAAVEGRPAGITALITATMSGCTACVAVLLDRGADPNIRLQGPPWNGETPLGLAVRTGKEDIVLQLLRRGARQDLYGVDKSGLAAYPLTLALVTGNRPLVVHLLAAGSNIDWLTPEGTHAGCTQLMLLAMSRPEPPRELAALALKATRNLDYYAVRGKCRGANAMMIAEGASNYRLALDLLRSGATPGPREMTRLSPDELLLYDRALQRRAVMIR